MLLGHFDTVRFISALGNRIIVWRAICRSFQNDTSAGIISARKRAALCAILRSDLRVQRAFARPFFPCELPRLSPALVSGMAFRRLSGASIHGKGLRVGALFQDPQCLIDIIVTNENFQSGFLSRLNKQVGYKTAAPVRLACRWYTCAHLVGMPYTGPPLAVAQVRGSRLAKDRCGSEAAVAASHRRVSGRRVTSASCRFSCDAPS